jgi:hypothetical protein
MLREFTPKIDVKANERIIYDVPERWITRINRDDQFAMWKGFLKRRKSVVAVHPQADSER